MTPTVGAQAELGASVRGRHSLDNGKDVGHGRQRVFRGRAATTPPRFVCLNTPTVRALRLVGGRASLARCSGRTPLRKGTERRVPLRASELALMWLHNLLTVTRPLHSVCVSRRECALPRLALSANCRQRTTCAASVTVHSKPHKGEAIQSVHTGCRRWPRLMDARYACWQWRVRACLDVQMRVTPRHVHHPSTGVKQGQHAIHIAYPPHAVPCPRQGCILLAHVMLVLVACKAVA